VKWRPLYYLRVLAYKLATRSQRATCQVVFGMALVVSSHFLSADIGKVARDTGSAVVVYAATRWITRQHGERKSPRNPTMRFKPPPEKWR
jgi:hypothetical protein